MCVYTYMDELIEFRVTSVIRHQPTLRTCSQGRFWSSFQGVLWSSSPTCSLWERDRDLPVSLLIAMGFGFFCLVQGKRVDVILCGLFRTS